MHFILYCVKQDPWRCGMSHKNTSINIFFSLLPVVYPTIVKKTNLPLSLKIVCSYSLVKSNTKRVAPLIFGFEVCAEDTFSDLKYVQKIHMFLGPTQYKENTRIWFYVEGDIHKHDNFAILKFSIMKNPLLPEIWKWIIWCFWEFWHHSNSFRNQNFWRKKCILLNICNTN